MRSPARKGSRMMTQAEPVRTAVSTQRCRICSGAVRDLTVPMLSPLVICRVCRHVSWLDQPTPDELREYYTGVYTDGHAQRQLQEQNRSYYRTHLQELRTRVAFEKPALLDFGSSWPTLLEEAQASGHFSRCIGVEWDAESRRYGREIGLVMVSADELDTVLDRSVHIARFSHVLEHTIDPCRTLAEVVAKMAPGGIVYITQPSFPALRLNCKLERLQDAVYPEHLHYFTPGSVARMLARCGLALEEFAAHGRESDLAREYNGQIATAFVERKWRHLKELSPRHFNPLGLFPTFLGDNSHCYARVR